MPEPNANQPAKKSAKMLIIVSLVIIWTLIVLGVAYLIWGKASDSTPNAANQAVNNANSNSTPSSQFLTNEQREQARMKDQKRLSDIKMIQAALESYKNDSDSYPESLSQLAPTYLKDIPQNTFPGGQEYVYTPIGTSPYALYDLSYALEVGVDDVSAGEHVASPSGVATP